MRAIHDIRTVLLVAALGVAACKDSSAPVVVNAVGAWSGTTSQGRAIRINATTAGVTGGSMSFRVTGTSCSADVSVDVGGGSPAPIANNAFTAVFDLGPSVGMVITAKGTFQSSTSASGTLRVDDQVCKGTLNATWTASKS